MLTYQEKSLDKFFEFGVILLVIGEDALKERNSSNLSNLLIEIVQPQTKADSELQPKYQCPARILQIRCCLLAFCDAIPLFPL